MEVPLRSNARILQSRMDMSLVIWAGSAAGMLCKYIPQLVSGPTGTLRQSNGAVVAAFAVESFVADATPHQSIGRRFRERSIFERADWRCP